MPCTYFSDTAAAFLAPPLCFNTAFTIFCSSIRNARTMLNNQNITQIQSGDADVSHCTTHHCAQPSSMRHASRYVMKANVR